MTDLTKRALLKGAGFVTVIAAAALAGCGKKAEPPAPAASAPASAPAPKPAPQATPVIVSGLRRSARGLIPSRRLVM